MTDAATNPVRFLAERWKCSTDDILDMSLAEIEARIIVTRTETQVIREAIRAERAWEAVSGRNTDA